jgi:hypothetical protein
MSMLAHLLVATALIVAFILLRMFADRSVLRDRLRKDQTEEREECISCALKTTQLNRASTRQS